MKRSQGPLGLLLASLLACSTEQGHKLEASSVGELLLAAPRGEPPGLSFVRRCGAGGLTEAGRRQLRRLPYVQRTTESSVVLLFTTAAGGPDPRLEVRSAGVEPRRLEPTLEGTFEAARQWRVEVEGLKANTYYCYALEGLTRPLGFRTAPPADSRQPVRFVAFGDSGSLRPEQRLVRDEMMRLPFDLMLHTGDVAYEGGRLSDFESKFFGVYAPLLASLPIFPVAGNHDYRTDDAEPFRRVFALPENGGVPGRERWYSFDWGPVHFVALDTEQIASEQVDWLQRDLSRNHRKWTIAYLHRPPYSSGKHGGDSQVREVFAPIFERYRVPLVLAGHDHDYERTVAIRGVTYVVTGGGGRGTRPVGRSPFTAFSEDVLHFLYVEVLGEELRLHAIDGTGQRFDSLRLGP